jgi:hypothetical protein
MLVVCRTCARPFIFFAREQQYWYEDLHFYIDTDCVHCPACRAASHEHRDRLRRYSEHVGRADLDAGQLATLVGDAVFLWKAGTLHDEQKLRWLRNLARRRIPQDPATVSIDRLLASLDPPLTRRASGRVAASSPVRRVGGWHALRCTGLAATVDARARAQRASPPPRISPRIHE